MAKHLPRILTAIRKLRSPRGCSHKEIFEYINSKGHQMYRRTFVSGMKKLEQSGQLTVKNGRFFMSFPHHAASVQPRSCKLKKKTTEKGMKNTSTKKGKKRLVGSKRYRTSLKAEKRKVAHHRSIPTRRGAYHVNPIIRPDSKYKPRGRKGSGFYKINEFVHDLEYQRRYQILPYREVEHSQRIPLDKELLNRPKDYCKDFTRECIKYLDDNYNVKVYTDASAKNYGERVGIGIYSNSPGFAMDESYRAKDYLNMPDAELLALVFAIKKVKDRLGKITTQERSGIKLALLSDNWGAIEVLSCQDSSKNKYRIRYDFVDMFMKAYNHIVGLGVEVTLVWVPSHSRIPGNERADTLAGGRAGECVADQMDEIRRDHNQVLHYIVEKLKLIRPKTSGWIDR